MGTTASSSRRNGSRAPTSSSVRRARSPLRSSLERLGRSRKLGRPSRMGYARKRAMGFLFGDSSTFPLDFNFLSTLESFMACATKVVMLEAETDRQTALAVEHGQDRLEAVEAV